MSNQDQVGQLACSGVVVLFLVLDKKDDVMKSHMMKDDMM